MRSLSLIALVVCTYGLSAAQVVITGQHVKLASAPPGGPATYATTIDTGTVVFDNDDRQFVVTNSLADTSNSCVTLSVTTEGTSPERALFGVELNQGYFRITRDAGTAWPAASIVRWELVNINTGYRTYHRKFPGSGAAAHTYEVGTGEAIDTNKAWVTYTALQTNTGFYGETTIGSASKLFPTTSTVQFYTVESLPTSDTVFAVIHTHDSVSTSRVYAATPMEANNLQINLVLSGDSTKEMLFAMYTADMPGNIETDTSGAWQVTVQRIHSDSIRARREIGTHTSLENWCVQSVQFLDGTKVYHTYRTFGTSDSILTVTHSAVDWARTSIFAPNAMSNGIGRCANYTRYWGRGVFGFRRLTSTTYQARRRWLGTGIAGYHIGTLVEWGKVEE